ncbi:MAG TPA: hypothetical protein VIT91_09505 [Chthoniobacterales bacterium]
MKWFSLCAVLIFCVSLKAGGQAPLATPPRQTPLNDVLAASVPADGISEKGQMALAIKPEKWRTAETPNFYIHYRRQTEARKVAREIEFDLFIIAQTLGVQPSRYSKKSHVYVFEDENEWREFIIKADMPEWVASFAHGDELFLNVRETRGSAPFDSRTLAHETTHAVVARIYGPQNGWPLWLNEGFAEYMGGAAISARKNQTLKRHFDPLFANGNIIPMSLDELEQTKIYPQSSVARLYESGQAAVRLLMISGPPDRFVQLVNMLTAGKTLAEGVEALYGDKFKNYDDFKKAYFKITTNSR